MIAWENRSSEERALLNPAFCSTLIWFAARARQTGDMAPLSIEEAFMVLPLVLPETTRESLPATIKTSLPVWLEEHPVEHQRIAQRAKALVPFSRLALSFGGAQGMLAYQGKSVLGNENWIKPVRKMLKTTSKEVQFCALKAEFVGRWFAKAGTSTTVLALMGVRP